MIADQRRTQAYVQALRQTIRPGQVVLDIGTGTGVFAILAARLGARRVFAVEPDESIGVAREIARANDVSDRIEFLQAMSTAIDLPERADVIVSDLHGVLPVFHQHLAAIIDARHRHLAPGGVLIPRCDTVHVAAATLPQFYGSLTAAWDRSLEGIDMSSARALAVNTFYGVRETPTLASSCAALATLDYARLETPAFSGAATLEVRVPAIAHGLAAWFDATLADDVGFSTNPTTPRMVYGFAFFPWTEPIELARGDRIEIEMRADLVGEHYLWSWSTGILGANASKRRVQMQQSEFMGQPLSPASLRRQAASHVPCLSEEGAIAALILGMMGESRPLSEIAQRVSDTYPARFPRLQDALTHVAGFSLRYGNGNG